jgi:hypothetical protein
MCEECGKDGCAGDGREEAIPDTERSPVSKPVHVWVNMTVPGGWGQKQYWAVSYVAAQGELVTWLYASEATARMMADRVRNGEFKCDASATTLNAPNGWAYPTSEEVSEYPSFGRRMMPERRLGRFWT